MFEKIQKWYKKNRLRIKLLVTVIGVVLLFLSISTYFSVKQTGEIILDQLDVYGNSMARSLANFSIEDLIAWDYPSIQLALNHIGQYDDQIIEIEIYHKDKLVAEYISEEYPQGTAWSPGEIRPGSIPHCECLSYEEDVTYFVEATGETMNLGSVRIILSKKKYEAFLGQQLVLLLYLSIILLIGDSIFSYLTVKWLVLNPIDKVREGAEKIGKGDLKYRIDVKKDDEIGKVAQSVNEMAENLMQSKKEADDYKKHLEEKVRSRTKELNELTNNLENKVQERTKELQGERNKTRATLFSLPAGLIVVDENEKITLVNPSAEEVLNIREKEVLGKKISEVKDSPNLKKLYNAFGKKLKWTNKSYEFVTEEDLMTRHFQVTLTRVKIGSDMIGLSIILHDITREKEIERMKNEFISISAHQLRTPSSAIKWTLSMLLGGEMGRISKEGKEYLQKAKETNDRMIGLINDLLNISRIEEGRFIYDKESVSVEDLVGDIVTSSRIAMKEKDIEAKIDPQDSPLPKVEIDKEKMTIAFQNIIENAIRYSPKKGRITVRLKQVEHQGKPYAQIEIEDQGIGIPKEDQKRLFTKFYRAENAVRTQTEGSGLGLFITKNIINAHGGRIWVESQVDKGTLFYIRLPLAVKKVRTA